MVVDPAPPPVKRIYPANRKRTPRKLNDEKVLAMAKAGVPAADIARHQGVDPSTIHRFLQAHKQILTDVDIYKAQRADIHAGIQLKALDVQERILATITDGVLEAAKLTEKAMLLNSLNNVFGTCFDKERLERGESTSNISVLSRVIDSRVSGVHRAPQQVVVEAPRQDGLDVSTQNHSDSSE